MFQRCAASRCLCTTSGRTSLIQETLESMVEDQGHTHTDLRTFGQKKLTLEERKKRRRALNELSVPSFKDFISEKGCALTRLPASIFQLNIGLYCNQACNHCHVESSPKRTEKMSFQIAERCLTLIKNSPSVRYTKIIDKAFISCYDIISSDR